MSPRMKQGPWGPNRERNRGGDCCLLPPSVSTLCSKRVLLHRLPILIGPDTDWSVKSNPLSDREAVWSACSLATLFRIAPESPLTKEQGTPRKPLRLVTLNSPAPHVRLLQAFVCPQSSLPLSVTCSHATRACFAQICMHLQKCIKYKDTPIDTQIHAFRLHLGPKGVAGEFDHRDSSGPEKVTGCFWLEPSTVFAFCAP